MSAENLHLVKGNQASDDPLDILLNSPLIMQAEVIGTREGGLVDCWVPTELVDHEEVPVKEEWASSLAKEMRDIANTKGGTGQLSPVILGLIEGEDRLKIMDGFHRDAALKINGEERVYAAVQLTDWDGLYDVRIFTAKDHAHVRFSRVVQWIREVWNYSGLNDKMTLEQAILLYRYDNSGTKLGLEPSDVEAGKAWVARKEQQWDMAAMTIHGHLKIAETVDPRLVHSTREKTDGSKLEAPTQAILKIFSDQLPDDFDLQNLVMEKAMLNNLKGPEVRTLCERVRGHPLKDASLIVGGLEREDLKPTYEKTKEQRLRRAHDARYKGASVFARAEWEIQSTLRRAQLSAERGEEIDIHMSRKIREAIERANSLASELGKTAVALGALIGEGVQPSDASSAPAEASALSQSGEVEDADGLRQDIIAFLSGESVLDTVRPFSSKQLTECFREIDKRKSQPEGWRDRFAHIQQAQAAGKLTS